ncbi:MAG: hypothetical protein IJY04_01805 [Clostridia bacterium]|nr:hypothetical protein [Clostridia bacterium]
MKKKVITVVSVLLVLLVSVQVVSRLDFIKKDNIYVPDEGEEEDKGDKNNKPRDLYEPDWETDIFTLPSYLEKNPDFLEYGIYNGAYVEYSETLINRTKCFAKGGSALALMYDYFDYAKHGDHEAVNGLFRDDYFDGEEKKPYEPFPMQKIYDIFVREYEYDDPNFEYVENAEPSYYLVTYKIMLNDGLFRYEIDADTEQPQLFGVLTYADGTSEIYMLMDLPDFVLI